MTGCSPLSGKLKRQTPDYGAERNAPARPAQATNRKGKGNEGDQPKQRLAALKQGAGWNRWCKRERYHHAALEHIPVISANTTDQAESDTRIWGQFPIKERLKKPGRRDGVELLFLLLTCKALSGALAVDELLLGIEAAQTLVNKDDANGS